jgi:demethylmenaquinone methyltransferase/2-methoxy-6-polyprenyl-1,4-benzoquinol methylase
MREPGRLVGLDFTPAMLDVAKKNELKEFGAASIEWIEADALHMPFSDGSFDGVIIGCGLRNFPDFDAGLAEMARVLKPGGRIVCLELALPQQKIWRQIHRLYLRTLFSAAGNLGLGPEKNYGWVLDSLDRFPSPLELIARFEQAGFCKVGVEQFLGGLATIHFAVKGES